MAMHLTPFESGLLAVREELWGAIFGIGVGQGSGLSQQKKGNEVNPDLIPVLVGVVFWAVCNNTHSCFAEVLFL